MSSDVSMLLPIPKQLREFLIQQSWTHSRDRSSTGRNVDRSHTCMPITNAKNCSRFARDVVPLLGKRFDGANWDQRNDIIDVIWHFEGEQLRLILNLSEHTAHASAEVDARTIWQSEGVEADAGAITLPPWTGCFFRS